MRWVVRLCGAALLSAVASTAVGQGDRATLADALFEEGRAALDAGDLETARARFAESDRIEPTVGAKLNLALIEERLGRVATAWELYRAARDAMDPSDDRLATASERARELEPRVPRLTIAGVPSSPPHTAIALDDVTLGPASVGVELPVNPGRHVVVVTAPGHTPARYEVTLAEGAKQELVARVGAALPPSHPSAPRGPAVDPVPETRRSPALPLVLGGVGLGLVGTAAVLVVLQDRRYDDLERSCAPACDPDDTRSIVAARWAAAATAAGGALALGAALVVSVGHGRPQGSLRLGPASYRLGSRQKIPPPDSSHE